MISFIVSYIYILFFIKKLTYTLQNTDYTEHREKKKIHLFLNGLHCILQFVSALKSNNSSSALTAAPKNFSWFLRFYNFYQSLIISIKMVMITHHDHLMYIKSKFLVLHFAFFFPFTEFIFSLDVAKS